MSGIFLSYRRDDSSGHAGRLYDRLRDHFGNDHVFRDVEALEPGVDFVAAIDEAVGSCGALVAIIGSEWLTATTPSGTRRLDEAADFVRIEIGAALARNVPVFPILVEGARMPSESDLPPPLVKLSRHQSLDLSESRWDFDVGRLIAAIERSVAHKTSTRRDDAEQAGDESIGAQPAPPSTPRRVGAPVVERPHRSARRVALPIAFAVILFTVVGFLVLRPADDDGGEVTTALAPTATTISPPAPAEVIFRDDFSGRTGWTLNDDERYASSYVDGAFRLYVKQTTRVVARAPLAGVIASVHIGVDATKLSSGDGEFGLFCRAGSALLPRYEARIDTNGDWRVAKVETASGPIQTLGAARGRSEFSRAVHATGVNRIELACNGGQASGAPVALTLSVNGQQVAVLTDQQGLPPGLAGVIAQSSAPPMDVRFDNFVIQTT